MQESYDKSKNFISDVIDVAWEFTTGLWVFCEEEQRFYKHKNDMDVYYATIVHVSLLW